MNIKVNKVLIEGLLDRYPHLRDDDQKLLASVWKYLLIKNHHLELENISGIQLLTIISQGALPNSESITRCRRKLQEINTDLRGELWDKRHNHQTDVIEQVRSF